MMSCKSVTDNLLTVLGIFVEPGTSIENPKGYIEASLYIRQPTWKLNSSNTVKYLSLSRFLFSAVHWDQIVEVTEV